MGRKATARVDAARRVHFPLGRLMATPGVLGVLGGSASAVLSRILGLHMAGDWGEVDAEDWAANDAALEDGSRLLSAYSVEGGLGQIVKVWIITEADRSVTTVLLPEEY